MSRLDIITIVVVVLCVAALGYLIYKTTNLLGNKDKGTNVEELVQPRETKAEEWPFEDNTTVDTSLVVFEESSEPAVPAQNVTDSYANDLDKGTSFSGNYMVIAGSFSLKSNAETRVRELRNMGYANAEIGYFNKKSYASAIAGRFDNKADADKLARELKVSHGIDAYVQKKQ